MSEHYFTGWDIGGAHLKVAGMKADGKLDLVKQYATPLWQGMRTLVDVIPDVLNQLPINTQRHAVTMTAELVDIFPDRKQGIAALAEICETHIKQHTSSIRYYAQGKMLLDRNAILEQAMNTASANWHASVQFVASKLEQGLFIDIGSTTTDIIPFAKGRPLASGYDDQTRMQHNELVYTGVVRTPLMALANNVPFAGQWQSLAAEHFASTGDIYRLLNLLKTDADLMPTADGAGKDERSNLVRIARMLGTDLDLHPEQGHWLLLAEYFKERQLQLITDSIFRVMSKLSVLPEYIVGAGVGCFLVEQIAARTGCQYIEFASLIDCEAELKQHCNYCAPAVALADINRQYCLQ